MPLARIAPRVLVLALAALLATAGWPASAARAADDSNIPGVPLPGSVVTGQLGGPIYDHVYSLNVPANSVILASLTGTAGTDFDLYLFDRTATTVYQTQGQVAQSTGPGSNESITYATPGGGLYYIDLNGATNVQGTFRLTVSVLQDTTSPTATLTLDGGAVATNQETVTAVLVGTDNLSGVDEMQLSEDGFVWDPMQPYQPTFLWTFATGDGPKVLYARVHDRAGNVSETVHATILLDTVPPHAVRRDPGPNGIAAGLRPTLAVEFDEAIRPTSWLDNGLVVQRTDSSVVTGAYAWDPDGNTGTFVPSDPLVPGEVLRLSLGNVVDLAGNPVAPIGTWAVTVLATHEVVLGVSPSVVTTGGTTRIIGTVDVPISSTLTLERSVAGGDWTPIATLVPDSSGRFSRTETVVMNSAYRVRVGQSPVEAPSVSSSVRVLARRKVVLAGASTSVPQVVTHGTTVTLTAVVSPSAPSTTVTLVESRYDTVRRAWVTVATLKKATSGGKAVFSWKPSSAGAWTMRVATPSGTAFTNAISPLYRYTVK